MSVERFVYCTDTEECGWEGARLEECPVCGSDTRELGSVIY